MTLFLASLIPVSSLLRSYRNVYLFSFQIHNVLHPHGTNYSFLDENYLMLKSFAAFVNLYFILLRPSVS